MLFGNIKLRKTKSKNQQAVINNGSCYSQLGLNQSFLAKVTEHKITRNLSVFSDSI